MKSAQWLLIPPVVAALLVLGPMSMGGGSDAGSGASNATATAEPADARSDTTGSLVPRTPDMWKLTGTLVGVLLLGGGLLLALKKLRGGATPSGAATLATLRQTVRLSPKQALHAIEFDGRILLVGESDKGLTLVERGRLPDAHDDEARVLARVDVLDDDDGAVPKNMVIPRPDRNAPRPASDAKSGRARLNDFRTLLDKAAR